MKQMEEEEEEEEEGDFSALRTQLHVVRGCSPRTRGVC